MKRALHIAGHVAVGTGLTGALVALAAAPAFAASGSLTVSPSGTLNQNTVINASGSFDNSTGTSNATVKLSVHRPDSSDVDLYTKTAGPLTKGSIPAQSVDTSTLNLNGDYVFTLSVGTATTSKTVTMRVPPATVGSFAAAPSGTVAHFTWSANGEPDLAGYDIVDVTDSQPRDLTPSGLSPSVCSGSSCSVDIDFGSGAAGTSRTFVAYALRYTSAAHSATIPSAGASAPSTVAFPAPPPPSPASNPGSSGSGTSSGSGGSTAGSGGSGGSTGGTTTGGVSSGGSTSTHPGGSRGGSKSINSKHASTALKAYLPTVSAGAAPNLPSVVTEIKPLPQGTYKPTLAYPDQVIPEVVHKPASTPIASVRNELVRVLDTTALWKALAAAAVVLLVAGHLRAWLESVDLADS